MRYTIVLLTLLAFMGCSAQKEKAETETKTRVQQIVDNSIAFHGMEKLNNADFSLTFRDMDYTYSNQNGMYTYSRTQTDSLGQLVYDEMNNNGLVRLINGDTAQITEEKRAAYTRSVNSVIYFFRLPFGLNDPAVNKEFLGETEINGKTYLEVKVSFEQQGGGEDFDDVFLYWFDKEDYSMDYLAYLYHTDEGGIRFREATNPRRVNGMLIQDYINYKPASEDIDFMQIDELYKANQLEVLSEIINEDVKITWH